MAQATADAVTHKRADDRVPAGSNWSGYMSYAFYYGVPLVYTAAVAALILFGSGWFKAIVATGGWLLDFVGFETPNPAEISMRTVAAWAIISVMISTLRLNAAIKIPPEATLGQSIDRAIAVLPIVVMFGLVVWGKAKGWTFDPLAWKCMTIAFLSILLQDFWTAGLAQKQIAAYRRRLDVV